ncbi:MAG TPA: hypothetical protein PLZ99_02530 [Parcubacteria group bacterium]|jgi:hypothetical protein|nr:hypothetical protein [Parcubacteria group bacterium]
MSILIERNFGALRYKLVVRDKTIERLKNTCFRGPNLALAGNFLAWVNMKAFLNNSRVIQEILSEAREINLVGFSLTRSIEVNLDHPIGWSSTAELDKYPQEDLEEFFLNRHATALRVKMGNHKYKAPKTNTVTIVFEFKDEGDSFVIVIHSIYPGIDIGELNGDVSKRENVVFFDWNHPGEK